MGPLCLALVLDICSGRVVGRTTGKRMTADLVLSAPNMATEQSSIDHAATDSISRRCHCSTHRPKA